MDHLRQLSSRPDGKLLFWYRYLVLNCNPMVTTNIPEFVGHAIVWIGELFETVVKQIKLCLIAQEGYQSFALANIFQDNIVLLLNVPGHM